MWVVELLAPDSDHLLVLGGGQVNGHALKESVLNSVPTILYFDLDVFFRLTLTGGS